MVTSTRLRKLPKFPTLEEFKQLPEVRAGGYIRTFTGKQFWPLDPRPEDIVIEDIAHALSMVNRFNGHTPVPYSVAQHSVLVSQIVDTRFAFEALMHDASEAYIADLVSPAKAGMPGYKRVEKRIMAAIRARFGMVREEPAEVKAADRLLYYVEVRDIMGGPLSNEERGSVDFHQKITPLAWSDAEKVFLDRLIELSYGYLINSC